MPITVTLSAYQGRQRRTLVVSLACGRLGTTGTAAVRNYLHVTSRTSRRVTRSFFPAPVRLDTPVTPHQIGKSVRTPLSRLGCDASSHIREPVFWISGNGRP